MSNISYMTLFVMFILRLWQVVKLLEFIGGRVTPVNEMLLKCNTVDCYIL